MLARRDSDAERIIEPASRARVRSVVHIEGRLIELETHGSADWEDMSNSSRLVVGSRDAVAPDHGYRRCESGRFGIRGECASDNAGIAKG